MSPMSPTIAPRSAPLNVREAAGSTDLIAFDALLLGYLLIGNRFAYSWAQAWPEDNGLLVVKPGGKVSTLDANPFAIPAWNMNENGDDGAGIEAGGVNIDGPAYPPTFFKQPIRGDDGINTADPGAIGQWAANLAPGVVITPRVASDADTIIYLFDRMNQHDGNCTPPQGMPEDMQNYLTHFARTAPALQALLNRFNK